MDSKRFEELEKRVAALESGGNMLQENEKLKEENQALRDEIAKLKKQLSESRVRGNKLLDEADKKDQNLAAIPLRLKIHEEFCKAPLGAIDLKDLYEACNCTEQEFKTAIAVVESQGFLELVTDAQFGKNKGFVIRSKRGLLSYAIEPRIDLKKIVLDVIKSEHKHDRVLPIDKILKIVNTKHRLSHEEFEQIIRKLSSKLQLEQASSHDEKGGIYLDNVYYMYITGVAG